MNYCCNKLESMAAALFLLLLLLSLAPLMSSSRLGNETDLQALLAIKNQSSWNHTVHVCDWEGVSCIRKHDTQRISALELASHGLTGSLSPFIGNLSFLRRINSLPPEIRRLHRLLHLDFTSNSFAELIPVNLSYCLDLQMLNLSYNHLMGRIPDKISNLSKLKYLSIRNNNITGVVPPWLGNLSSLKD